MDALQKFSIEEYGNLKSTILREKALQLPKVPDLCLHSRRTHYNSHTNPISIILVCTQFINDTTRHKREVLIANRFKVSNFSI